MAHEDDSLDDPALEDPMRAAAGSEYQQCYQRKREELSSSAPYNEPTVTIQDVQRLSRRNTLMATNWPALSAARWPAQYASQWFTKTIVPRILLWKIS